MPASISIPRHLERSLVLMLDGPAVRRGGEWRQEQPDPDAAPKLIIRHDQTMAAFFALGLVEQLSPYRCLPRMGLTEAGRQLAAGIGLRTADHMRAFTMAHLMRAAAACASAARKTPGDGPTTTDGAGP